MSASILEWQNEHLYDAYPLTKAFEVPNLIVDATFVQYDDFIPVLNKVTVDELGFSIDILLQEAIVSMSYAFNGSDNVAAVLSYTAGGGIEGTLCLSAEGINTLKTKYVGRTLFASIPFVATTVNQLDSTAGVYSLGGKKGEIEFSATATNDPPWSSLAFVNTQVYDASATTGYRSAVRWDAVDVGDPVRYLKTINGKSPVNNGYSFAFGVSASALTVSSTITGISIGLMNLGAAISSSLAAQTTETTEG